MIFQGLAEAPFKTSDDVLNLDTLADECVVLGGGIVACELAQFLARVGCRVTQLQRSSQVLKEFSTDAGAVVGKLCRTRELICKQTQLFAIHRFSRRRSCSCKL